MVSHVYTFTPQAASSQEFVATLTVTDSQNKTSMAIVEINAQKPSAPLTPVLVVGAVNLRLADADYLRMKLSVPGLIHAPIAAGNTFTVRVGNGINTQTFFTFVVNAHGLEQSRTERIAINTRTGIVQLRFGNSAAHNLIAFYNSLGITESSQSLATPFRIQLETNTTLYTAQTSLVFKGAKGHGRLTLPK
jgi:hypothetical protein